MTDEALQLAINQINQGQNLSSPQSSAPVSPPSSSNNDPALQLAINQIQGQPPASVQPSGGSSNQTQMPENTVMQMLTNRTFPGQRVQAPTLGQTLTAGGIGIGQALQNSLKSPIGAVPENFMGPQITKQINQNAMNGIAPVANYNLNNALGIKPTPMQSQIESTVKNAAPIGAAILGAGMGSAPVAEGALSSLIPEGATHGKLIQSLLDQMPIKFSSSDLSTKATSKWMPKIMEDINSNAKAEYAKAGDYIDGNKNAVDLTGNLVNNGKQPTDADLLSFVRNPDMRNPRILQNPTSRQLLVSQWQEANPSELSILPQDQLDDLSKSLRGMISNFTKNPTGRNLLNLRSAAGDELASADWGDAASTDYRNATKQVRDISDKIMENHLSQDSTGTALKGWRAGNDIKSKQYYPLMNNKTLNEMSSMNPRTISPQNPKGLPYYRTSTPKQLNSAVTEANTNRNYGLPYDHPVSELNDVIQNKYAQENKPPGILRKYGPTVLATLAGSKLLGHTVNHIADRFSKNHLNE